MLRSHVYILGIVIIILINFAVIAQLGLFVHSDMVQGGRGCSQGSLRYLVVHLTVTIYARLLH